MKQNSLIPPYESSSLEETFLLAAKCRDLLFPGRIVALTGDLGAGKTTFVKGLASHLGSQDLIQSPTYVYLHIYEGVFPIFHFDLYRIKTADDFLAMGFQEYFFKEGITLIEWPEKIASLLPPTTLHIHIQSLSETKRLFSFQEGPP